MIYLFNVYTKNCCLDLYICCGHHLFYNGMSLRHHTRPNYACIDVHGSAISSYKNKGIQLILSYISFVLQTL